MRFTKTDFKKYLICPKCLWLEKKQPDKFIEREISDFLAKLIKDGYEVEKVAQGMFPEGINVPGNEEEKIVNTKKLMREKKTLFQATFYTDDKLFVKTDILKFDDGNNNWDLYEVKSSSEIKTDLKHNHIKDITFQKIALKRAGVSVGKSYIIHLNKEYVRRGELELDKLFVMCEVSEEIRTAQKETENEIKNALGLLSQDDIDLNGCDCLYKSYGQRCDCFSVFNPQVPEYSTAYILRGSKLAELNNLGIFDVKDIPDDFKLTPKQREIVELQRSGRPKIDKKNIEKALSKLQFPLYFLDYETLLRPIPILDGYKPNQQIVFQYSLHVLNESKKEEHFEYLADDLGNATSGLVKSLEENIGEHGNIIVWHEQFERDRNRELAELHPEYKKFFENLNERIFDLKNIFSKHYLLPEFYGSASIKTVLPIIVPELSYKDLSVQDGTMAMSAWEEMLDLAHGNKRREKIRNDLLEYCKMDTFAMLEIYKKVLDEISKK